MKVEQIDATQRDPRPSPLPAESVAVIALQHVASGGYLGLDDDDNVIVSEPDDGHWSRSKHHVWHVFR